MLCKQEVAIAALLSQPTMAAEAQEAGVGKMTLHRWMQQQEFIAAYRHARSQAVEGAIGRFQASAGEAVSTLTALLASDSDGVRLRAAVALLDFSFMGVEMMDMETRLEALESAESNTNHNRRGP